MAYTIMDIGYDYYRYWQVSNINTKTIKMNVETPIAKIAVDVDDNVEWELIAKVITLLLVTYGGIKIINKVTK